MNGWKRIGVVLTAIWFVLVVAYAAYERSLLPIRFFGEEVAERGHAPWQLASGLIFVQMDSGSRDYQAAAEAALRATRATSEPERQAAAAEAYRAATNALTTSLTDLFWLCLLAPIALLWTLSYLAVFVSRWVIAGFRPKPPDQATSADRVASPHKGANQ